MIEAFQTADYRSLPVIFIVLVIFYWLKAWRWKLMLSPTGDYDTNKDLLPPIMIGFGFNNLLPAHLGEFVRCFVFARQQKVPFMLSFSSVALERVFDVIVVLLFLVIGLLSVEGIDDDVQKQAYLFAGAAAVAVMGAAVYVIWTKPFVALFERVLKLIPFIPHSLVEKICGMVEAGAAGLESIKNWRLLVAIIAVSIVKWAFNGTLIALSLWSFGITTSVPVMMLLLGVIAFGVTIPAAPGYFGVIQMLFMLVMGQFVKDEGPLFAASIYYHMSQYVPVTLIGLYFFIRSGISLKEVEEKKEETEEHLAEESPISEDDETPKKPLAAVSN